MIIHVILGNNIDTFKWIKILQRKKGDQIIVVDYNSKSDFVAIEDVIFMSPIQAQKYTKKFKVVNYYKSLYVYPGMQGNMSSLYKKDKN